MFFTNLIILGAITYFGYYFLSFTYDKKTTSILFFITYIVMCVLNEQTPTSILSFLYFICICAYLYLQFDASIHEKINSIVLIYITLTFIDLNLGTSLHILPPQTSSNYQLLSSGYFCLLLIFIVHYILSFFIKAMNENTESINTSAYFLLSIPAILMVASTFTIFGNFLTICTLSFDFVNFVVYLCFTYISIKTIKKSLINFKSLNVYKVKDFAKYMDHYSELKSKEKYSQTKYDLLDQQYKNSFNLLHDILDKSQELSILLEEEDYQKAYEQLNTLTEMTFKEFNNLYTNSVVFNTLIRDRIDRINNNQIHISSTIEYNDFNFIDFCDQIDLFGNLLDYAIENCMHSDYKDIIIKSKIIANKLIIQFQFAGDSKEEDKIKKLIQPILKSYDANISISNTANGILSVVIAFLQYDIKK